MFPWHMDSKETNHEIIIIVTTSTFASLYGDGAFTFLISFLLLSPLVCGACMR